MIIKIVYIRADDCKYRNAKRNYTFKYVMMFKYHRQARTSQTSLIEEI